MAIGKHTSIGSDQSPQGDSSNNGASATAATFKVSFRAKAIAFICTTITLSWFFEGCREIGSSVNLPHCFVLAAGVVLTIALLGLQGYWIYIEEKLKGTLKKRIGLFETIYARSPLSKRFSGQSGEES